MPVEKKNLEDPTFYKNRKVNTIPYIVVICIIEHIHSITVTRYYITNWRTIIIDNKTLRLDFYSFVLSYKIAE